MDSKDTRSPNKAKREVFHPSSWWSKSPSSDFLLIDLPGFKLNDIKIELLSTGKLSVKGCRQLASDMYFEMEETFNVPNNIITEQISTEFENGVLTFIMPKRVVEVFQPSVEWKLVIHLPGFKENEINVEASVKGGAVMVLLKGRRQVSQNKYLDVDQSFEIPQGTITEKMKKVFMNGSLTIIMPKRVVEEHKSVISKEKAKEVEGKEDEKAIHNKPKVVEEGKNESVHKERQQNIEEQQVQKEKQKCGEDKKDELIGEEKQTVKRENVESREEKIVDSKKITDSSLQKKEAESIMEEEKKDESIKKEISTERGISVAKTKESRKILSIWIDCMDGLLGIGSRVCSQEKLKTNRKLVVVALVAFFVGYVSCKLRACGK